MGPKVKKPVKSAFSFFLDDYVAEQRAAGRQISYKIGAEECGALWTELDEYEKQRYSDIAAAHKVICKETKVNKFTCTGLSYAQLEKMQEEIREKIEKADAEIKMTISNLDADLLPMHLFYIIHCNYYCKTDTNVYVPGEIAIAEFNLGYGVKRTFHTLINPGPIPLGFAFEAKQTIEEVHGLPYPPFDEGSSDYFGILHRILSFLEPGRLPDGKYPPLYCLENNIKASENILQALLDTQNNEKHVFRVYLLHKMFFWLKNKCVEDNHEENVGFPVLSNAETEISKDIFCYVPEVSCPYHIVSEDKYQNCSLSVVQRFVYLICDHCCQHIGVELVPGKHCPLNSDITGGALSKQEDMSISSRSIPPSEFDESEFEGQSSYSGYSEFDWHRDRKPVSFLHDELEAKFSRLDTASTSSISSTSTLRGFPVSAKKPLGKRPGFIHRSGSDDDDDDEDDFLYKFPPLGRGKFSNY